MNDQAYNPQDHRLRLAGAPAGNTAPRQGGPLPGELLPGDEQAGLDATLCAQLDHALAPESVPGGVPQDLTSRILNVTEPLLARRRRLDVIAVFRDLNWTARLAACLLFAALLGLGMTGASIVDSAHSLVTLRRDLPATVTHLDAAAVTVPWAVAASVPAPAVDHRQVWNDLQNVESSLEAGLTSLEQDSPPAAGGNTSA